jgi:hypothetical protein
VTPETVKVTLEDLLRLVGEPVEIQYVVANASDDPEEDMPWTVALVRDPMVHSHAATPEEAVLDVLAIMARQGAKA